MDPDAPTEPTPSFAAEPGLLDLEDLDSVSSHSTTFQPPKPLQSTQHRVSIDDGKLSLSSNVPSTANSVHTESRKPAVAPPPMLQTLGSSTVQTSATGLRLSSFDHTLNNNATSSLANSGITPVGAGIAITSYAPSLANVHHSSRPPSVINNKGFISSNRNLEQHPLSNSITTRHSITKPSRSSFRYDDDNASQISTSSLATSFSKSFLFGFLNNRQKDKIKSSAGLLSKEYWMKDETSAECFICGRLFTTFRRKHHCRICGQIFCSACTTLIPGEKFNYNGKMRVCKTCTGIAKDYNDSSDDDTSLLEESFVERSHSNDNDNFHDNGPTTPIEEHPKLSFTAPTPPPRMAIPATRNGESVEIPVSKSFNSRLSSIHTAKFRSKNRGFMHRQHDDGPSTNSNRSLRMSSSYNNSLNNDTSFIDYVNSHNNSSAFNFNSDQNDEENFDSQSVREHKFQDSDSEDEGSMSIYTVLHLDKSGKNNNDVKNTVKQKIARSNTRSLDRAQASLLRIRNRKKSKSTSKPQYSALRTNDANNTLFSSPNLSSPIVFEDTTATRNSTGLDELQDDFFPNNVSTPAPYTSELNDFCLEHFKNLLHQTLTDEGVPEPEEWEKILIPLLKEIEKIEYNVKAGESMDIRQYIKLKRLTGGSKDETIILNGIIFSKTFALKSMPKEIPNARIALIMFPLEYMRTGQHYMSLDPVLAQENEYIHKLVARIIALNADVVFVGASVSGLALKLLDDAGIAVAYNMKPQVIEKIARLTQADIVISMDKLAVNLRLGQSQSLTVKTYAYGRYAKTVMSITVSDERLGATLLIRGGNDELLRKVKESVEFMVYVIYNLKLETAFYRDNFMYLSQDFYQKSIEKAFPDNEYLFGSDFLKNLNKTILSSSPTVQFDPPALLIRIRDLEKNVLSMIEEFEKYKGEVDLYALKISNEVLTELKLDPSKHKISKADYLKILKCYFEKKIELHQDSLNIRKRQWNLFVLSAPDLLDPMNNQRISFLYSMVSNKNATPCIGPHPLQIDYYWDNDMTLGQYVEHLISSAHNVCSEGCGGLIADHYRSYVHDNAKVDVIVEKFHSRTPTLQNIILTWSYCKQCGYTTPYLPMSEITYKYSFGKFLELSFWSAKNSSTNLGHCIHDFSKDHIKYFSLNDLTVRMEYSKVDILELIVPRIQLAWKPHTNIALKIENHEQVIQKSQKFFNSILSRLNRVKVDSISTDKMEAGQKRTKQLIDKANEQQSTVNRMIEEIYDTTDAANQLAMNSVLRFVQDLSVEWDSEFTDFENNYLPSEKDIARITTHQLKRFFLDDNDAKPSIDEAALIDENEKSTDEKIEKVPEPESTEPEPEPELSTPPEFKQKSDNNDQSSQGNDLSPIRKVSNSSFSSENNKINARGKVLEEVSKFEKMMNEQDSQPKTPLGESFQSEQSSIMKKTPSLNKNESGFFESEILNSLMLKSQFGISAKFLEQKLREGRQKSFSVGSSSASSPKVDSFKEDSKVMKLTSYFDQIHFETLSKEFEMQREKERLKLIQNRYKAAPVSSSKPIVEVYKNVNDAVIEDDIAVADDVSEQESIHDEKKVKAMDITNKEADMPQPERVSLMKTLANFWADRSAALWQPLAYPLGSSEHIFVDSDVIVREDEPSSLVSFCLSSSDYVQKISVIRQSDDLEAIMLKKTAVHLKYQFNEGSTILSCKIFFAEQFDAFRRKCGIDEKFIQSLSRCIKWDSAGGKSGSAFLKTLDDRFVIKELSTVELDSFVKFAPSYFEYMAQALFHDLPTVIAKIFGFYQIHIKNPIDGRNLKMDILITENLFYEKKNLRIFDLKGSMRNRHVQQTGRENEVLLDENMVEYIYESPLFLREYDKKLLKASLWNDTLFLAKMNVMDYSLVIGIDDENKRLTVGIIDCIRTFTWDKKLESWVKEKGFVGGGTKEPTVVTPRQYKNRFREAMDRYIFMVPGKWSQGIGAYAI